MRTPDNPFHPKQDDLRPKEAASSGAAGAAAVHPARRPPSPEDLELTDATIRWMAALPEHVRPILTGQKHPHVLNRLCAAWQWPMRVRNQFLDLMIDQRGTRRGFSFDVLNELSTLQGYYASQLTREQRVHWDDHNRMI